MEEVIMSDERVDYKEELLRQIEGLPDEKIKEILDFAYFVNAREAIDPSQAYFWTKKWQAVETEADQDKEKRNVFGDGTVEDLLRELRE
jgi:hypothetical protein